MRIRRNPRPLLTVGDVLGEALAAVYIGCIEFRGGFHQRFDDWMARWDEKHANAINGEEDQA